MTDKKTSKAFALLIDSCQEPPEDMTTTKERLRELVREADIDWHRHWDDEPNKFKVFAKLIRKEALEEVAVEFDGAKTQAGEDISASIRAMKDQL